MSKGWMELMLLKIHEGRRAGGCTDEGVPDRVAGQKKIMSL